MVKITFARKRWNNSRYKLQNNTQHWTAVSVIVWFHLCISGQMYTVEKPNCNWRRPPSYSTDVVFDQHTMFAWAFGLVSELLLLQNTHSYITKYLIGKVSTINRQTKQGVTKYSNVEYTYCFNLLHPHVFKNKAVMQGWKHRTEVTL